MQLPKSNLTLSPPVIGAIAVVILLLLGLAAVALRGGDADVDLDSPSAAGSSDAPGDPLTSTGGPGSTGPGSTGPAASADSDVEAEATPAPASASSLGAPTEPGQDPQSTPTGPPLGLGGEQPLDGRLAPGTCVSDDGRAIDTASIAVTDCAVEHTGEVFATTVVDQPPEAPFPGESALEPQARAFCQGTAFSDYLGVAYEDSALFAYALLPTEASWATGDRAVACVLYDVNRPLVGSQQGSG